MLGTNTGAPSGAPDLVWLVHRTDNEELRHSIRSVVQNAPGLYNKLWIAGEMPPWLRGVGHIPVNSPPEKFASIRAKVTALANDARLADRVVIFNDDYFLMDPIASWDAYHMGPTSAYLGHLATQGKVETRNTWVRAVANTARWMQSQGHGDILCYEGHVPLLFDRRKLADVLAQYPTDQTCDYPGFYPIAGAAGVGKKGYNAKVADRGLGDLEQKLNSPDHSWLSSNDVSFAEGMVGGYIRGAFRTPSPYERTVE